MIRWIVGSSLKYNFLVITIVAVIMLVGVNQIGNMPVDILPEFSPPYVEIQTEALGLSAEEVEQMITVPMEQDLLAGVAWLNVIKSRSVPGLSSVVVYFEPGTDLFRARQMVSERLAQAAVGIPHVSKPPTMIQPTSSASRFMIIGLSSKELSLIEMSVLVRWTIGPRLMGVPGVANVSTWGNRDQELQVLVNPEQLREAGVSLEQVVNTTGNALWVSSLSFLEASSPGTGGFLETPNQRLGIWHVLPISSPEDLAQVPVNRTALKLGDITKIVEDHQPLIGDALVNNNSNLLLVIEKLPGTDTIEVTKGVDDALAAIRPGFSSINFDATVFRLATFIEMASSNLTRTIIISALLVVLVLSVLFYGWRTALISLVTIPISLVLTLFVLNLQGAMLNTMVLAGLVISLGIIIDDAVVDIEHIMQCLRQNHLDGNPRSIKNVIVDALIEVRGSLFFTTLITLIAVLPFFFLQGESGALLKPLVISYVLAVLAAMVVALMVTPVLSLMLLSEAQAGSRESPLILWLKNSYEKNLKKTIKKPRQVLIFVVVLMLVGIAFLPFVKQDQMLPTFQEPYIVIQLESVSGTSLAEMDRIVARASSELSNIPGVRNVSSHIGRAVSGDQIIDVNSAELWLGIEPKADYDGTLVAIQDMVDAYIGMDHEVQTYLHQTLSQLQTGDSDGFTVRVYGEDYKVLLNEVEKVRQTVAGIAGVVEAQSVLPVEKPTIEIEVDLSIAQQFGVKPGEVRRAATTLLSGIYVGSIFEEQKIFDVVVRSTPEIRQSLTDIRKLLIDTPKGGHVRLGEVADVRIESAPTVIQREAISPFLDVVFNVHGRNARSVLKDVDTAMQNHNFPLEYHAEVKDDYLVQQKSQMVVLIAGVIAVFGIFLLLQAVSESWRLAVAIFLSLLAALVGCVLVAFLSATTITLTTFFGLFAVLGIGVRNSVLLIKHYQILEQEGEVFGPELLLRGSRERLAPILMTSLTTGLALLPFVLFGNFPGNEITHSMVIVILGGLVTSTLVSLFVLPALYLQYGARRESDLEMNPAE